MQRANDKKKKKIRCSNGHLLTIDDQQIAILKKLAGRKSEDDVSEDYKPCPYTNAGES